MSRSNSAARIFQDFPNIPKREFTRKEFRMLVKVLSVVLAEWEGIGLCLEIAHKMMENLQNKWKKNSTMGLISVVDEWMKGNYEEKKLYPCWYSVVYVVADGLGGQNPAAARNIAHRWKTYEEDPFFSCPVAEQADITKLHTLDDEIRRRFIQPLWSDYLQSVGHRWFEIGVLLGVPFNKLEVIENEQNKLMEVIQVWINLYDDSLCHYLPAPTIRILVDAVYNIMGGNNQALATKIADNVKAPVPSSPNGCSLSIAHSATSTSVTQQRQQEQAGFSTVCAVQDFTEAMTPDELCLWLHRCYQMPPNDCKTMKDNDIGGLAFKLIMEEEKWNDIGISVVGLILLKGRIMKEICPAVPDPGQTTVLAGHSSARNGGGSGCGLAQGNGTHNTSGTVEACVPSSLPASAFPYLKLQLDWGHEGVDRDLIEIARLMVGWEEKLCSHLGLTDIDVHDIREKYKDRPELQRREALRIWKNNQALRATYGNLLDLFVWARHARCAEAVREIIRKKC